ncbi:MAG: 3,4-dihydroxy-2-butanone-4-phosphate synthase [Sphingomonas sp.]|nr:3,4-dihydroxy-2-butanone-4-phosphate synthase [Sphingomonas sp.]
MPNQYDLTRYDGRLAIMVDSRVAEGAGRGIFFRAARGTSEADVRIMTGHGRGICTVTIDEPTAMRLRLYPQGSVPHDADLPYLANSVEATSCTETGISAQERATTMDALGRPGVKAEDLVTPGHIMVQVARNVFRPEASLPEHAYMLMSARTDSRFASWCDILNEEGDIASADECTQLAAKLGLDSFPAADVEAYGRVELADWVRAIEFSKARFS